MKSCYMFIFGFLCLQSLSGLAQQVYVLSGTVRTYFPLAQQNTSAITTGFGGTVIFTWTTVHKPVSAQEPTLTQPNGPTNSSLKITNITSVGVYKFMVKACNVAGTVCKSDTMKLFVRPNPNQSPVATVASSFTFTFPDPVAIPFTIEDTETDTVRYYWKEVSGVALNLPPVRKILPGDGLRNDVLTLAGVAPGTYQLMLTVIDEYNAKVEKTVSLTVLASALPLPVNTSPVVSAGANQIITLPTGTAGFTGTATDAEDNPMTYIWDKISGGTCTLSNANSLTLGISGITTPGEYVFRLTATDNLGASGGANVKLTVLANPNPPVNLPPVVSTGIDQAITLPVSTANFTGTATDPEGRAMMYVWEKVSGDNCTLSNTNTLTLNVSNITAKGNYVFKLTATDNLGASSSATVQLVVSPDPLPKNINKPPVVSAGKDTTIILPATTLLLFGSAADPEDKLKSVAWSQVSGPNIAAMATPLQTDNLLSGLAEGIYVFQLTATDQEGLSASATLTITVKAEATKPTTPALNRPPVVTLDSQITFALPLATYTFKAQASDPDNDPMTYTWTKISGPEVNLLNVSELQVEMTGMQPGIYIFELTARDNRGGETSARITVTVTEPPVTTLVKPSRVFAPGVNDAWKIEEIEQHPDLKVSVYNQQGRLVMQAQPYHNDWNGISNGKTVPEGAYFYIITQVSDGSAVMKGSFVLFR
jgi:gliding motility-associated-like protein